MGAHHRAIQHQVLHVRVFGKVGVHPFPNALVAPASKAFVHTVPLAILIGQQPPLGAAPRDPQHRLDKPAAFIFLANVHIGTRPQEAQYPRPLFVW
jgi:hypothetical protein